MTPPTHPPMSHPAPLNDASRRNRRCILLVEDNDAHAEIAQRAFKRCAGRFQLHVSCSLSEARALLAANTYDLVICDWNLPDGHGIEMLPPDSEDHSHAVLLMTSHGSEEMAVRALKAGSVDYIVKTPETLSDLPHLAERALCEWDNRVARRGADEAIRASLREKEALLQEIHHRVKNNLQIVSSLLQLQANEIADPRLHQVVEASQTRIRAMAMIHEMLYQSDSLARINLGGYLRGLSQMLLSTYARDTFRPRFELDVSGDSVNVETAIPLGLIANELIVNALKHAFPHNRPGLVRVECGSQPDGQWRFSVDDDGIGFPARLKIEESTSLGLKLISMFARKLRGTVTWRRTGVGSGFQLVFPSATKDPPSAGA